MNWIEINEERTNLPEPCSDVLITHIYGATQIAYFDGDGCFYDIDGVYNSDSKVIAWMYLPKPFQK